MLLFLSLSKTLSSLSLQKFIFMHKLIHSQRQDSRAFANSDLFAIRPLLFSISTYFLWRTDLTWNVLQKRMWYLTYTKRDILGYNFWRPRSNITNLNFGIAHKNIFEIIRRNYSIDNSTSMYCQDFHHNQETTIVSVLFLQGYFFYQFSIICMH